MADLGLCFLHMQRAVFLIVQVIYIDDRINSLKIPRSYKLYHIKAFLFGVSARSDTSRASTTIDV